jgi:hypothetical protein
MLLFVACIGPWFFLEAPWMTKLLYVIGTIVIMGLLSLIIASILTSAYMTTVF